MTQTSTSPWRAAPLLRRLGAALYEALLLVALVLVTGFALLPLISPRRPARTGAGGSRPALARHRVLRAVRGRCRVFLLVLDGRPAHAAAEDLAAARRRRRGGRRWKPGVRSPLSRDLDRTRTGGACLRALRPGPRLLRRGCSRSIASGRSSIPTAASCTIASPDAMCWPAMPTTGAIAASATTIATRRALRALMVPARRV